MPGLENVDAWIQKHDFSLQKRYTAAETGAKRWNCRKTKKVEIDEKS